MASDDLERGEGLKAIEHHGWLILWDGTPEGWIRCRPPVDLEYWP